MIGAASNGALGAGSKQDQTAAYCYYYVTPEYARNPSTKKGRGRMYRTFSSPCDDTANEGQHNLTVVDLLLSSRQSLQVRSKSFGSLMMMMSDDEQ